MTTTTRKFDAGKKARRDPERAKRIDAYKRGMRDALTLARLREQRGFTQVQLAGALDVSQENVSRIERQGGGIYVATLGAYVEALGGRLEIAAVFDDEEVPLITAGKKSKTRSAAKA